MLTLTFEVSWDSQTGNKISVTVSHWYTFVLNMLERFVKLSKASHKVAKARLIYSKLI